MIRHLTAAILAAFLALPAAAQVRVVDGDTIDAGYSENVRLVLDGGGSFDAPETWRPSCDFEARLGAAATQRLRQIVRSARTLHLDIYPGTCGRGRRCGALIADGRNVGDTLIAEGLAVRSRNADWCR